MLTRQRHCLHFIRRYGDTVVFSQALDEPTEFVHEWRMPAFDWEDAGEPEVITITMEPRDVLNES